MTTLASSLPAENLLRLTTLNLNHAPDEVERRTGLACDELGALQPVVLCLQEVRYEAEGLSAQLETITAETGLTIVAGSVQGERRDGGLSGNAILSSLPRIDHGIIEFGTPRDPMTNADYAVLQATTGQTLIIVSTHLAWGGNKEGIRLAQATAIDRAVRILMEIYEDDNPVAILAGDFNTTPGSDTNRYLSGHGKGADGGYTYWTEAFATVGRPEDAVTVAADNHWAAATARIVGIQFPEMLPDRRIDYVWTFDWAHGRAGCPVAFQRSFTDTTRYGFPASDHYGLTVDFWTPSVLAGVPAELLSAGDDLLTDQLTLA